MQSLGVPEIQRRPVLAFAVATYVMAAVSVKHTWSGGGETKSPGG